MGVKSSKHHCSLKPVELKVSGGYLKCCMHMTPTSIAFFPKSSLDIHAWDLDKVELVTTKASGRNKAVFRVMESGELIKVKGDAVGLMLSQSVKLHRKSQQEPITTTGSSEVNCHQGNNVDKQDSVPQADEENPEAVTSGGTDPQNCDIGKPKDSNYNGARYIMGSAGKYIIKINPTGLFKRVFPNSSVKPKPVVTWSPLSLKTGNPELILQRPPPPPPPPLPYPIALEILHALSAARGKPKGFAVKLPVYPIFRLLLIEFSKVQNRDPANRKSAAYYAKLNHKPGKGNRPEGTVKYTKIDVEKTLALRKALRLPGPYEKAQ